MECKKIQDWLITDHLDGELTPAESSEVRQHMEGCAACREFWEVVRGTVAAPFKGFAELRPDPIVWQKIRGMIATEEERSVGWLEKIEKVLAPAMRLRPVFQTAFVAALFLMIAVFARWPSGSAEPAYAYVAEQMTFMDDLQTGNPDLLNGDVNDEGIVLEEIVG